MLAEIHARDDASADRAVDAVLAAYEIGDSGASRPRGILLDVVGSTVPELPEVETIRAQLAPRLEGRTLASVEILDPRLTRPHDLFEVVEELEGDRVVALSAAGSTCCCGSRAGSGCSSTSG